MKNFSPISKQVVTIILLLTLLKGNAQEGFKILSRKPVLHAGPGLLGITKLKTPAFFELTRSNEAHQYQVEAGGASFFINALNNIEYSAKADRIVTYGDVPDAHAVFNAYVKIYSGTGTLIKSLGLVATWPYSGGLSANGSFIIAGNKSIYGEDPSMFLALFDKNGNRKWEKELPKQVPTQVYSSADNKYIALALNNIENGSGSIQYYDASGVLLYSNSDHTAVTGIEFLPSDKVVITEANTWFLYDMVRPNSLIASGTIPGNTIGKYPITAHPSKHLFFLVSESKSLQAMNGYSIRAHSSVDGTFIDETVLAGTPYWQPYRMVEVATDGSIQFLTSHEILSLGMK